MAHKKLHLVSVNTREPINHVDERPGNDEHIIINSPPRTEIIHTNIKTSNKSHLCKHKKDSLNGMNVGTAEENKN